MPPLEANKKVASKGATPVVAPKKGTSVNLSYVLGLNASVNLLYCDRNPSGIHSTCFCSFGKVWS